MKWTVYMLDLMLMDQNYTEMSSANISDLRESDTIWPPISKSSIEVTLDYVK